MITAVYTSLLAIWLVFLSFRVIALRGSPVFAFLNINTDDEEMLQRAIRAHGNLTEYAPMMVVLLYLLGQTEPTHKRSTALELPFSSVD